ncbi:PKD domain-containing protein [Persicobacter sp. CCB-QB2]|uniref:PKD domain-containing protein n=1 Tax=Persicobacter sp. CCB-QB2 TaxID=1561025 RepID=UPI000B0D6390|nr:PKD domain-containing protein [Persicobacter sp. CCB-QB2]
MRRTFTFFLFCCALLFNRNLLAQDCSILGDAGADLKLFTPSGNCSGEATVTWSYGWNLSAANAALCEVEIDWDDGVVEVIPIENLSMNSNFWGVSERQHTYDYQNGSGAPGGNNDDLAVQNCTYLPKLYIRINGVRCTKFVGVGSFVTVWDTEDNHFLNSINEEDALNGGSGLFTSGGVGDYNMCAGNTNEHFLVDLTIWNCTTNPEESRNPNNEGRWVQYVYGETNSVTGGEVSVGGQDIPSGQVYYGPVEWIPGGTAGGGRTLPVRFPPLAGENECFSVRLRSWNVCNRYGPNGSDQPAGSFNPNDFPYANDPVDLWTRTICTVEAPEPPIVPDVTICAGGDPTLRATAQNGATVRWYDQDPTLSPTPITPIYEGNPFSPSVNVFPNNITTHTYWVTQAYATVGSEECESLPTEVNLTIYPEIKNNTIAADQEICFGGNPAELTGSNPTGGAGAGTYTYQWERSVNGGGWSNIGGATGNTYDPPVLANTTNNPITYSFRRKVYSGTCDNGGTPGNECTGGLCESISNEVDIIVYPELKNNSLRFDRNNSTEIEICFGESPGRINGSTPTGGFGGLSYIWEKSEDGGNNWSLIAGATNKNYTPGNLLVDTQYRRTVTSANCGDDLVSNVVKVWVRPDLSFNGTPYVEVQSTNAGQHAFICYEEAYKVVVPNTIRDVVLGNGDTRRIQYAVYEGASRRKGWTDGNNGDLSFSFDPETSNRTFNVRIRYKDQDNFGDRCIERFDELKITVNPEINVDAGLDLLLCEGESIVLLGAANGGSNNFKYNWSGPSGLNQNNINVTINPADGTYPALNTTHTYTFTVSENGFNHSVSGEGCEIQDTREVTIFENPTGTVDISDKTICPGVPLQLETTTAAGGSGGTLTYQWRSDREGEGIITNYLFSDAAGNNPDGGNIASPYFIPDGNLSGSFEFWLEVTETNNGHPCTISTNRVRVTIDSNAPTAGILTDKDESGISIPAGLLNGDGSAFSPDCTSDLFVYEGTALKWRNTINTDSNYPAANFDQVEIRVLDQSGNVVEAQHLLAGNTATQNASWSNLVNFPSAGIYRVEMILTNTAGGSGCNVSIVNQLVHVMKLPNILEVNFADICQGTTVTLEDKTNWSALDYTPTYFKWEIKNLADNSTVVVDGENGGADPVADYEFNAPGSFEVRLIVTAAASNGEVCDYSKVVGQQEVHEIPLVSVSDPSTYAACGAFELDLAQMATDIGLTFSGETEVEWTILSGSGKFKFDDSGAEVDVSSSKYFDNFYKPVLLDEDQQITLRFFVRNPSNIAACQEAFVDIPVYIYPTPKVNPLIDDKFCYGVEVTLNAERTDKNIPSANVGDYAWDVVEAIPDFPGTIGGNTFTPNTSTEDGVTNKLLLYPTNVVAACNVDVKKNFSDTVAIYHNAKIVISNLPDELAACSNVNELLEGQQVGGTGNYSYRWYLDNVNQGNNSPNFNFSQTVDFADQSKEYVIRYEVMDDLITTSGLECKAEHEIEAKVYALPEVKAAGDQEVCFGDDVALEANILMPDGRASNEVRWFEFVGGQPVQMATGELVDNTHPDYANIYPDEPLYPNFTGKSFYVQVEDEFGCKSVLVDNNPDIHQGLLTRARPAEPSMTGQSDFCMDSGILPQGIYGFNQNAYTGTWNYDYRVDPDDGSTTSSIISQTKSFFVQYNVSGAYDIQAQIVQQYPNNLDCPSPWASLPVVVNPEPLAHAVSTNENKICEFETVTFRIDPFVPEDYEYEWVRSFDYQIADGATDQEKDLTFISSGNIKVQVKISTIVKDSDGNPVLDGGGNVVTGCATVAEITVPVSPSPDFETFLAENRICSGAEVDLNVSSTTAYDYEYTFDGANISGGVDGSFGNVTTFDIKDVLTHNEAATQIAKYSIRAYEIAAGSKRCFTDKEVEVEVAPSIGTPTISVQASQICDGERDIEIASDIIEGNTYTWYISTDAGATFGLVTDFDDGMGGDYLTYFSNVSSPTLVVRNANYLVLNGAQFKLEILACNGLEESNAVTLNIIPKPMISRDPVNVEICEDNPAAFDIEIEPYDSALPENRPVIQWERWDSGSRAWVALTDGTEFSGVSTRQLTVHEAFTTADNNNANFRAKIQGLCDNGNWQISQNAVLTIYKKPALRVPLVSQSVCDAFGGKAEFYADALNTYQPTYQWQVSTDGGASWVDIDPADADYEGVNQEFLLVKNVGSKDQYRYSVTIGSSAGFCSTTARPEPGEEAILTVLPLPDAFPQTYEVCTDNAGGLTSTVNLTNYEADVKGSTDSDILVFWYVDEHYTSEVSNKFAHQVRDGEKVYPLVRNLNNCQNGTEVVFNINVRPAMDPNMPSTLAICSDTELVITPETESGMAVTDFNWALVRNENINGLPTADSGQGAINWTLGNTTYSDQGFEVVYTAYNGDPGCVSLPFTITTIVNPQPVVTLENNRAEICDEAETAILVRTPVSPANQLYFTYAIDGVPQLDGNGDPIKLLNYESIAETLENLGQDPQDYSFEVTPWRNGCALPGLTEVTTVSVNPTPVISLSTLPESICSGDQINLEMTSATNLINGFNLVYTYSSISEGGFGTVVGDGVQNGSVVAPAYTIAGVLENRTFEPQKMVYEATPTVQGCDNNKVVSVREEVIVKPVPVMSISNKLEKICNGAAMDILLSSPNLINALLPNAEIRFKGTAVASDPALSGFNPNIDLLAVNGEAQILDALSNTSNEIQTLTITLRPYYDNCEGEEIVTTVQVYPTLDIQVSNAAPRICSEGQTSLELQSLINITGFQIAYRAECASDQVFGYSNFERYGNVGDVLAETITNMSAVPQTVTYYFRAVTDGGLCDGPEIVREVVVDPNLTFDLKAQQEQICNVEYGGFEVSTHVQTSNGQKIQFRFESIANANVNGALVSGMFEVDANGNGAAGSVLTNTDANIQEQRYRVWMLITDAANSILCQSVEREVGIFIRPSLNVDQLPDVAVCPDELVVIPAFSGAASYTWTNDNPSIGLAASGDRNLPVFTSVNDTDVDQVANIEVIGNTQGCYTTPMRFTITVKPTPETPVVSGVLDYCQDDALQALTATGQEVNWYNSSILGSGSWVGSGNTFTPAAEDVDTSYPGLYTLYVTQTINGCESEAEEVEFIVNPKPFIAYNLVPNSECTPLSVKLVNVTSGHNPDLDLWEYQIKGDPSSKLPLNWDGNNEAIFQNNTGLPLTYEVIYTAGTDLGCFETVITDLEVMPQIEFMVEVLLPATHPDPACSGTEYTFKRTNLGNTDLIPNLKYTWSFGDGSTLVTDEPEVTHLYENASFENIRNYPVALTVDAGYCRQTEQLNVEIYPQVLANLDLLDNYGCGPLEVSFINNSRGHDESLGEYQRRLQGSSAWETITLTDLKFIFDNTTTLPQVWEVRYFARNQYGCPDISAERLVTVNPRPVATFVHDNLLCEGSPAVFDASASTGNIDSYRWEMGDFTLPRYGETLEYTYKVAGLYRVTMTATNDLGCTDTYSSEMQIQISPDVEINAQGPKEFCFGGSVALTSEVNENVSYQWFKDEVAIAGETSADILVAETGAYHLTVTQLDGVGCSRVSDTLRITAYEIPNVVLERNKPGKILCPGEEVVFTADADLNIQTYIFYVNDEPFAANLERNSFRYSRLKNGDQVRVEAITYSGCSGHSEILPQSVDSINPNFAIVGPSQSCSPFAAVFEVEEFVAGLEYTWNFGDGTVEVHDSKVVTHEFINSSPFLQNRHTVKLTVYNAATDCSNVFEQEIKVNPTPEVYFELTADGGCAPLTIGAENSSNLVNITDASSWAWAVTNMTSGEVIATSELENPFFELPNITLDEIVYEVKLVGTDAYGCQDFHAVEVKVYPEIRPSFIVDAKDNTQLWPDNEFVIINTTNDASVPENWTYRWILNAQEIFVGAQIGSVVLEKPSVANLTLLVSNERCEAQATQFLKLEATNPIVDFEPTPEVACAPQVVKFENLTKNTDETTIFTWDFGDGTKSNEVHPEHEYENPNTYTVRLEATNAVSGGIFSIIKDVIIHPVPSVNFNVKPERVFLPDAEVQLESYVTGSKNIYTIDWGDGTMTEFANPDATHLYTQPDDYFITMYVENEFGCEGQKTIERPVMVRDGGKVDTPNSFVPRQDGPGSGHISENDGTRGYYPVFAPYTPNVVETGYRLEVYTRWGQLIYQTEVLGEGWNGYYFNSGDALPAGVYIFKLQARTDDGQRVSLVGDVTLLK